MHDGFHRIEDLPRQVQLVWHGVNDDTNLRHFLASPVPWAEIDVRRHPAGHLVLRHDPISPVAAPGDAWGHPSRAGLGHDADDLDRLLALGDVLDVLRRAARGVTIDVKETGILDDVLVAVADQGLGDRELWFNGRPDVLGQDGVRALRSAHPEAVVQCPVDRLTTTLLTRPRAGRERLRHLHRWGITRFSVAWTTPQSRDLLLRLQGWHYEVNVYAVPDLHEFLQAVELRPRSITADFNFPEWHYFGRGAGQGGRYHRYNIEPVPPAIDVA